MEFPKAVRFASGVCLSCAPLAAQTVLHQVTGDAVGSLAGHAVANLGDTDGDGRDDFAVSMILSSAGGLSGAGRIVVVSGATGQERYSLHGTSANASLGYALGGPGDLDGDGFGDLIGTSRDGVGHVHAWSGATGALLFTFTGSATAPGSFGVSIAGAGDVNNDGRPDILIGHSQYAPFGGTAPGYAEVYSGLNGALLHHWDGPSPQSLFGAVVAGAGDVDGDLHDDVLVSVPQGGAVAVRLYSGATGVLLRELPAPAGEQFGWSVRGGRDFNGDLVPDVLVGGPRHGAGGHATVWSGANGALLAEWSGPQADDFFGSSVAWVDDFDGDGRPEVAVGSYEAAVGANRGRVQVFGSNSGASLLSVQGDHDWDLLAALANSLDGMGDVDGDGRPEFVAGAWHNWVIEGEPGWARVYSTATLPPVQLCPGKQNSLGCVPVAAWSGTPSFSGPDDFVLSCDLMLPGATSLLAWNTAPTLMAFQGGTLCPARPVRRLALGPSSGIPPGTTCNGQRAIAFPQAYAFGAELRAGSTVFAQIVYRDPVHPDGTGWGLCPGVRFTFAP